MTKGFSHWYNLHNRAQLRKARKGEFNLSSGLRSGSSGLERWAAVVKEQENDGRFGQIALDSTLTSPVYFPITQAHIDN